MVAPFLGATGRWWSLPSSAHLLCVAVADATLDPVLFRPETLSHVLVEAKKHSQTEDSAVARINGSQYLPCGMERDTLTLGDGMGQAIKRFASQNQGIECEGREDLLQGYVEGLWSAPTAERHWRKVIVAQIIIAREEEVARAFGINHLGG